MTTTNEGFIIFLSFFIALILTILPMPEWSVWFRPPWVLLLLIYWTAETPYQVNVGIAWILGIILDALGGTLLGEHAFALTVVTYFVTRMQSRLRMFPLLQQGLSVFFLVLLYLFVIYCVQGFIGYSPHGWLYWSSALTSMLLWPWLHSIMGSCRRRYKVV